MLRQRSLRLVSQRLLPKFRTIMHKSIEMRLDRMKSRYREIEKLMNAEDTINNHVQFAKLNKELTQLADVATGAIELEQLRSEILGLQEMLATESDAELRDMGEEELASLRGQQVVLEERLCFLAIPKGSDDHRNAIVEVRAGTGGDEACLFAEDVFHMYKHYASRRGWSFKVTHESRGPAGGFKEAMADISGTDVYGTLQFESGVHRVQRVPATESSGRIHTSAMSVVVLPEADDTDFRFSPSDLRIDTFRASGAGGQHVNTTESAVRITHLPSGTVVSNQNERSQHQNKESALKHLRAKLFENDRLKRAEQLATVRSAMIGSGDRSAKIRTYNYPDDRVTDHRIGKTIYNVAAVLRGDLLHLLLDQIAKVVAAERLERVIQEAAEQS